MNNRLTVICFVVVLGFIPAVWAQASQSGGTITDQLSITPTLAPSKTATAIPIIATNTPQAPLDVIKAPPNTTLPFTQKDLSVLTGNIQRPNGLTWHDNKLYTACSGDWTVYEIDPSSGTTTQYIYGIKNAHSIYAYTESDGRLSLWIPDFQNNALVHINQGIAKTVASNLKGPWGIAPLDAGKFLVTNLLGNNLSLITADGETKEVIEGLRSPAGIAINKDYLYVANTGSARRAIEWFKIEDVVSSASPYNEDNSAPLVTGLQNVTSLVMASDGHLYFSYALGTRGVIGRVDPAICQQKDGCSNSDVEIVLYTELAAPLAGLTISPDMKLYVHSIFSPDIYWVQLGEDKTQQ